MLYPYPASPQDSWQLTLSSVGITQWHDRSSNNAAIYLGFLLTDAKHQLTAFLSDTLSKLQNSTQQPTQCSHCILGRSLVANSLIMSPIWHSIRILTLLQSFLAQVRSSILKFISRQSFSAVNFQPCQCLRKEDGITLIYLGNQHAALQICWLIPSNDEPLYDIFIINIFRCCIMVKVIKKKIETKIKKQFKYFLRLIFISVLS